MPYLGGKAPDFSIVTGHGLATALTTVTVIEVKPLPLGTQWSFTDSCIGQACDYGIQLLKQNRDRSFAIVVLSNGLALQFFKVMRTSGVVYRVQHTELLEAAKVCGSDGTIGFLFLTCNTRRGYIIFSTY